MLLGVDVGGTFTDAVLATGEAIHTAKVPTTPSDQSLGVMSAVDAVLDRGGAKARDVEVFAHGMTVGTNALLEERGARTALIATRGFTDLLDIGRQNRPHLYRLCAPKPAPLVPPELRFGAPERVGADSIIEPLDEDSIATLAEQVAVSGAEAVAICLLHSYRDPVHESRIAARLRRELPNVHVSASHEVLPQFREYERCSTTVIDAYLSPLLARYLERLTRAAAERGLVEPLVMQSSGGIATATEAARSGAWSVLSGPAGGAVGAGAIATASAEGSVLGFDMGGTSCDVCVIDDGQVRRTDSRVVGGRVLQLPMVDVHTVGAGGGSIGWQDAGGALRVGPRSAGAEPGPACYGRGGTEPTVSDAILALGYLDPESRLAGDLALDRGAADTALDSLGRELGLDRTATAEGIVRIANQEMVRALRVVTVERGVDPRGFILIPFGGAGPMHAAAVAEELEVDRIICPQAGGVLSALGLISSERRRDRSRTLLLRGPELTAERLAQEIDHLRAEAGEGLEGAQPEVSFEMRYRGQAFELSVSGSTQPDPLELSERFAQAHESRYGYRDPGAEVELVNIRLAMVIAGADPVLAASTGPSPRRSARQARFAGAWLETAVLRGELPAGTRETGPAILELPEATVVIPPGWVASVDAIGSIRMERS